MRKLLQEVVLTTAQAAVTFASIPQGYTDLYLEITNLNDWTPTANSDLRIRINGDSGSNYSRTVVRGDGSSASSSRNVSASYAYGLGTTQAGWSTGTAQFMSYANTNVYKSILFRNSMTNYQVDAAVDLWRSTAAITSLSMDASNGNFAAGSTFRLWGIV